MDKLELQWFVKASGITGVVRSVVAIQRDVENGFVVLVHYDGYVDVSVVAVIDTTEEIVPVQIAWV